MIFRNLDLFSRDPAGFVVLILITMAALLIAITVHEFSHALVADRLGDPTARRLGRLSLNPIVHLDLTGTLMLLLVGFGWGKPVPVNPWAFGRNALRTMSLVAFAGPLSNIVTAAVIGLAFRFDLLEWPFSTVGQFSASPLESFLAQFLVIAIFYNLILAVFNLIPLAPLDGSKVVLGILPRDMAATFHRLERWGPAILLGIIFIDWFTGAGVLVRIIGPVVNGLSSVIIGHSVF